MFSRSALESAGFFLISAINIYSREIIYFVIFDSSFVHIILSFYDIFNSFFSPFNRCSF